jgi:hypothetical protein
MYFENREVVSAGVMQVRDQDHVADAARHQRDRQDHGDAEQEALKAIERHSGSRHKNRLFLP